MRKKAEQYINENQIDRQLRPGYHVTAPVGWINDPNGFSVYQGKAHLFYQYHPYSVNWGPMHWGHCVSEDLIKWTDLPVALAPETSYDDKGCFSGSAIETEEGHVLVYTGVSQDEETKQERQNQCIAIGDGVSYEKQAENPVVTGDMLPAGFDRTDFRDPKVWKEDGRFYLVAGSRDENRNGQVILFSSENLHQWKYESVLANSGGEIGSMWECPDFFEVDGQRILICSPQDMCAQELEFHNGHNSVYFTGDYNKKTHEFAYNEPISLDYGLDFYAPQTTELPDGRRVLIAWMQSWDAQTVPAGQQWQGMMTLPRELTYENQELIQRPIREIEKYYADTVNFEQVHISKECALEGVEGRSVDFTVEIIHGEFETFQIDVAHNEQYTTTYTYCQKHQTLSVDRTYSGVNKDIVCQRRMKIKYAAGNLQLRFIMDRNSVEVFVNNGRQVFSTVIYTPQEADGIRFSSDGDTCINVVKHKIVVA